MIKITFPCYFNTLSIEQKKKGKLEISQKMTASREILCEKSKKVRDSSFISISALYESRLFEITDKNEVFFS